MCFVVYLKLLNITPRFKVNKCATSYPRWLRTMMGVSTAFVVFTFPPDIPLAVYVQTIPRMVNYIDDVK